MRSLRLTLFNIYSRIYPHLCRLIRKLKHCVNTRWNNWLGLTETYVGSANLPQRIRDVALNYSNLFNVLSVKSSGTGGSILKYFLFQFESACYALKSTPRWTPTLDNTKVINVINCRQCSLYYYIKDENLLRKVSHECYFVLIKHCYSWNTNTPHGASSVQWFSTNLRCVICAPIIFVEPWLFRSFNVN